MILILVTAPVSAASFLALASSAFGSSSSASSSVDPRRQSLAAGGEDLDEGAVDDLCPFSVVFCG